MNDIPDTRSMLGTMFGDMFGLGPLLKMATDPTMLANAAALMEAMTHAAQSFPRIEAKLDLLLSEQGHDVSDINRQITEQLNGRAALVLEADGRDAGIGGRAAATVVAHHGGGAAPPAHGRTGTSRRRRE